MNTTEAAICAISMRLSAIESLIQGRAELADVAVFASTCASQGISTEMARKRGLRGETAQARDKVIARLKKDRGWKLAKIAEHSGLSMRTVWEIVHRFDGPI